ncbi:tRNA lysidine(34) synthetase TilS [Tenacibaculum xiamenense]|uniref:tRNA lysidine(34) synthetase TilS n=1 Tax=Tenacibaculum xiamenense TaxID=1261553 RepID=UPI003892D69B
MEQKLAQHLTSNFPFLNDKHILLAISGGIDSVVAAHILKKLSYNVSLAHCNFQLRNEESDKDEQFVINLGKKLNLKTYTTRFNTSEYALKQKISTQIAARELRYNWFESLIKKHNLDYLVTAHHADDNLETFLINFSRGSGIDGLTGIPQQNGYILRPFLQFSREEIAVYAAENSILWREDASNSETKYLRNKLRHTIIPILKEMNPSILKSFGKTVEYLKQGQQIIEDKTKEVFSEITDKEEDTLKINIEKLKKLSNPKAYLYQILHPYGFTEWNDVNALVNAENGKLITTKSHTLLKDREFLLLLPPYKLTSPESQKFAINSDTLTISEPISLLFKNVQKTACLDKNSIYVDKNLLNYPLTVRKCKAGDLIYPKGMKGKKKVSKYLKDEKLSLVEKQNTWLLCSNKNEVIWIIGRRQDRRFLPLEGSASILQICIYQPL